MRQARHIGLLLMVLALTGAVAACGNNQARSAEPGRTHLIIR
jgi:hypothetical protein